MNLIKSIFIIALLSGCSKGLGTRPGDGQIQAMVFGDELVIRTEARLAGAIGSLTWRGQEFINDTDHGRQLQSSIFEDTDTLGWDYNPTEAGSDADSTWEYSTSKLLSYLIGGNWLATRIQMAFYVVPPGQPKLSEDIVSKKVTIGYKGYENVIQYDVCFDLKKAHGQSTIEVACAYMPTEFAKPGIAEGGSLPFTLHTADGKFAMRALNSGSYPGWERIYADWKSTLLVGLQQPTKWNIVYLAHNGVPAGETCFTNYIIVGTLEDVNATTLLLEKEI